VNINTLIKKLHFFIFSAKTRGGLSNSPCSALGWILCCMTGLMFKPLLKDKETHKVQTETM